MKSFKSKETLALLVIIIICMSTVACSGKVSNKKADQEGTAAKPTVSLEPTAVPTVEPTTTITPTMEVTKATEQADAPASISDSIPDKYKAVRVDHAGTIEPIEYTTYDYFGDKSKLTKPAYVYLPYGYDKNKQYNVLYLMHGIGGNEKEWGMYTNTSTVKCIMDNLIYYGDIEPFIVVVPNGRSSADYANTSSDFNSFYPFGKELRNDLIPYIDAHYATYAEYKKSGYDLTAAREHRAMAGLSMGGMQTINIGLCESLDMISYFGAFSAAPTTYTADKIVASLNNFKEYDIKYFYNVCGTSDQIAWSSATGAVADITALTDKLVDEKNYMWQQIDGGVHDFKVWYLGFYNFAQLVFKD